MKPLYAGVGLGSALLFLAVVGSVPSADRPGDAPETRPAFKLMVLLEKKEDMSSSEFERYFFDEHLPFVLAIPGVRGYTVNLVRGDEGSSRYDAVSEFWFDDAEAFDAAMASPEAAATLADAENMLRPGGMELLLVTERIVRPVQN